MEVHRRHLCSLERRRRTAAAFPSGNKHLPPNYQVHSRVVREKVSFLDTTVILDETILHTDLYTKPTDTHQYLLPSSCHPRHCTSSIPYSQALRLRRICSTNEDFQKRIRELMAHLMARGYGEDCVDRQIERAACTSRTNTLTPRPARNQETPPKGCRL